ncbi:hypothetical protein [Aestuariibius sp. HNIBRBA575]|uniref:hypothetical protein n=1 Tax=Aestuariibius sp. HNIBRBA575 TaxID=3233343 RepID=UPI0034A1462D
MLGFKHTVLGIALMGLGACASSSGLETRNGPQAVAPGSGLVDLAASQATPDQPSGGAMSANANLADALFQEFCVAPGSAANSERAIIASGRFAEPNIIVFPNVGSRFASYQLNGHDRTSVSVATGTADGLQCSVGISNHGPSLYENGSVSRS